MPRASNTVERHHFIVGSQLLYPISRYAALSCPISPLHHGFCAALRRRDFRGDFATCPSTVGCAPPCVVGTSEGSVPPCKTSTSSSSPSTESFALLWSNSSSAKTTRSLSMPAEADCTKPVPPASKKARSNNHLVRLLHLLHKTRLDMNRSRKPNGTCAAGFFSAFCASHCCPLPCGSFADCNETNINACDAKLALLHGLQRLPGFQGQHEL